jgi:hypothetical protein
MNTSLTAQLIALGLDGLSVKEPEPGTLDMPSEDAMHHTVRAAWNEIFGLFVDTPLERPAEDLAWGFVNIFHKAGEKQERRLDEATDQIRLLIADGDLSEIATSNLEEAIDKARTAEDAMHAFETMREQAAMLYNAETTHSWRPFSGGRNAKGVTSAMVEGRAYLQARKETKRSQAMPAGTPVVFSGGRIVVPAADATTFADDLFRTLDRVRERVGDMVLVHGGDSKGIDRFAAGWAERHKIPQIVFGLDPKLGKRAGFRRNEQMLSLNPRYVIAYPGNGVLERLVIDAKQRRISVVDRRGPLGTPPAVAAQQAA